MKNKIILLAILLILPLVSGAVDVNNAAKVNAQILADELNGSWLGRVVGGVDKQKVYQTLVGDASYRTALQNEYRTLTKSDLRNDLNHLGSNNSDDVIAAKLLLDQGRLTTVDKIFLHTYGAGTKEKLLFSDLVSMGGEEDRNQFQGEWFRKFGPNGFFAQGAPSVVAAIEGDLNEADRNLALKIYNRHLLSAKEVERISQITGKGRDEIINRQIERVADKATSGTTGKTREELLDEVTRAQLQSLQLPTEFIPAEILPQADCGPRDSGYRLCVGLPGQSRDVTDLGDYIRLLYQFALGIAGVIVFVRVVTGGIKYILSSGNIGNRGEAIEIITQAVWGLVLLLAAVLILYTIDPRLLDINSVLKTTGFRTASDVGGSSLNFDLIRPNSPTTR